MSTADIISNEFKDDELGMIVSLVSADGLEIVEMTRTSTIDTKILIIVSVASVEFIHSLIERMNKGNLFISRRSTKER